MPQSRHWPQPTAPASGRGGKRSIQLSLGARTFWQEFVLADVTMPVLGVNFFAEYYVIARKRLLDVREDDWAGTPRADKIICQVGLE